MLIIYLIVLILALLGGFFILWKVPVAGRRILQRDKSKTLSVIIPARNEAHNLPILLQSLQKQKIVPHEILVVDDDSTDKTVEAALEYGARVVSFDGKAESWVGKSAGSFHGAKAATGDYLLFLDADIFLPDTDSLDTLIREFQSLDAKGALSIQPYHVIQQAYENLSAVFNIIVLAGMNHFSFLQERLEPGGAFGPALLCDRASYFEIGGHNKNRKSIMQNMDLGRVFIENDLPLHLYGGKGVVHFRMYSEGLKGLIEGWSKNFATGSSVTHPFIMTSLIFWIAGAFLAFLFPFYFLIAGSEVGLIVSLIGYLIFFLQFYRMARLAGHFHILALFFYPILFLAFVAIFIWSLIKTNFIGVVSWKGRKIDT